MAKVKKFSIRKFFQKNLLPFSLLGLLLILLSTIYQLFLSDKFYPVTIAGNTNLSFLTKGQAIKLLQNKFQQRSEQKLNFSFAQGSVSIDLATSSAILDYTNLDSNFIITHSGHLPDQLKKQLLSLVTPSVITPKVAFSLDQQINTLALQVDKTAQNAQLIFDETPASRGEPDKESTAAARIQIKEAAPGFAVDKDEFKEQIKKFLLTGKYSQVLPLKIVPPTLTTSYVTKAKTVLEKSLSNPIKLVFEQKTWIIDTKQLLALLDLETGQNLLDKKKVSLHLQNIASEIDQNVQEGLFEFNPQNKKVTAFKPSREGRKLDTDKTYLLLNTVLISQLWEPIPLPVEIVKPKVATSDVNSLGIKELLGSGVSNFAGSIPNRIFNIGLTASKINGVLIPPGQTFSFNQTIGDISAATGFKQAYVIKEGRTVLDDGGGVCQDSTTLFRAVLNAGLPVVKRTAHAYRVGYYEQGFPPGLDATVFYPSVDFQFKNDTSANILIQAYTAGTTIYMDLYGTSDGRITSLTKPIVANLTPPPPDLRQDDPTLPKGTIKQVDWAARGATVTFNRTVTREGETLLNETWKSNFKPWQAVYLVGTQ